MNDTMKKSPRPAERRERRRRGSSLLMSLMYVTLFGALAVSMTTFSNATMQSAAGSDRSTRAYAAAESGMTFLLLQLKALAKPITSQGVVDAALARTLFYGANGIEQRLAAQLNGTTNLQGRTCTYNNSIFQVPPIRMFNSIDDTAFAVSITQDAADPRILRLSSTGRCTGVMKTITMALTMEKRLKYAIYSNVAIQIGKNAIVEGDIVSTLTGFSKGPPVWLLSDFRALSNMSGLNTDLQNFRNYIKDKNPAFDNRLDVRATSAANAAAAQGFFDRNADGFIDDWDLALRRIDANNNKAISTGEFTDPLTGNYHDTELFKLIDTLSPPYDASSANRSGYNDGVLDARDAYAKVKGTVQVGVTQSAWDTWAKDTGSSGGSKYGTGFREQFQGPVNSADPTVPPVQFAIDSTDVPPILPSAFDTSSYASQTGGAGAASGVIAQNSTVQNAIIGASNANGGTVVEGTPLGSTSIQATYKRPVFKNVKFKNCKIAKGTNALFQNCTFEGVTFVDMNANVVTGGSVGTMADGTKGVVGGTTTSDPSNGRTFAERMISGSFSSTGTLTSANSVGFTQGNNLRFDGCTFNGPVASANPTAYTHFSNSWEFTGATYFDNQVDPTATILAPNTNIEMGSFSNPNANPSTLVGVVVAGNIDIRGRSVIDGSIIVTGDGATNTTLAYFGSSDSASDANAMPEGGYGRLYMRYNPTRAMPNGISIPITLTPNTSSYSLASSAYWPW